MILVQFKMVHVIKIRLKVFLYIFCLSCLLYQSFEILGEYLSGKTVISLEIKRLEEEPIPALTICTRNRLSMKKISRYNNTKPEHYFEFEMFYQEYSDILKKIFF